MIQKTHTKGNHKSKSRTYLSREDKNNRNKGKRKEAPI